MDELKLKVHCEKAKLVNVRSGLLLPKIKGRMLSRMCSRKLTVLELLVEPESSEHEVRVEDVED